MDTLKILLLAGGHSSRMGSPKHLLPLADGPLYLHLIRILHEALPQTTTIHISIADRSVTDDCLREGLVELADVATASSITIKLRIIADEANRDIGPAAGLLAAYHYDPEAT
ncbi:hypothetical protein CC86DRAFT_405256 [Ophiobolus disseminans]|uniref:MobA-like NTP transferase domain-containing protein n=1 Tax=Ophiobolus disseminans TaxID=1469910 RepID=A0A6A7A6M9_9PLEO|nr:hypothetical protein CC86DRAFT_405256 [Ophiobolus disseminans]